MALPVVGLAEARAVGLEHVLDEEGHDRGQADGLFLAVGEAGDMAPPDQRFAVFRERVAEHAGGMADRRDRFTVGVEGFDQGDGMVILGEVPERTMAAGVEDRVIVVRVHLGERVCVRQRRLCLRVLAEALGRRRLCIGCVALRVERRLSALG
ncbi:hypothetical protein D3C78_858830 [compost metagenome]